MNRIRPCMAVIALALALGAPIARPARATGMSTWRLLSESPAFPPTFAVPVGVHDPLRHRVLVVESNYQSQAMAVWSFEATPTPRWMPLAASGTPPRQFYLASLVYDPIRDRLLVFGNEPRGSDTHTDLQVWALALSGSPAWQRLSANELPPAARYGHSTIFDPAHDRVIMFAGATDGDPGGWKYVSETWEYSLRTGRWTALAAVQEAPGAREGHGAMYDPSARRMLVFGGHYDNGARGYLNDLWALSLGDTIQWSELPVSGSIPGARSAFGTIHDPVRQRMLVHGGINADSGIEPDDLWALSLADPPVWTRITTEDTLRGRSYPVDIYDPIEDRLLACGGGSYPQTSALNLSAPVHWDAILPTRPIPTPSNRSGHDVVYDTRRERFLVMGGQWSPADSAMWSFAPGLTRPWQAIRGRALPIVDVFANPPQHVLYDSLGDRVLACTGKQVWVSPATGPWDWKELGPPAPAEARDIDNGAGIALDSRRNRLIVSGGWFFYPHSGSLTLNGVWAVSLGRSPEWSQLGTLPHVNGVGDHYSFYDPVRDRLVVVGGVARPGRLSAVPQGLGVWTSPLEGPLSWTWFHAEGGVPPRAAWLGPIAFDPLSQRLFAFAWNEVWSRTAEVAGPWQPVPLEGESPTVTQRVGFDPVGQQIVALFASAPGHQPVQAWALAVGPPAVSLVDSRRTHDSVQLQWRSTTAIGKPAVLERREAPADWAPVSALDFDIRGLAFFTDHDVLPEHDYAYRVRVADGDSSYFSPATFVAPPAALRFAMLGARPNPAVGRFQLAFSLPDAAPARLKLFDVRGRRCAWRDVGTLGAGRHTITFVEAGALEPGVYFAQLQRGSATQVQRVVLTR